MLADGTATCPAVLASELFVSFAVREVQPFRLLSVCGLSVPFRRTRGQVAVLHALMYNHFHVLLHAKNDTVSFITAYVENIVENACHIGLFNHICV